MIISRYTEIEPEKGSHLQTSLLLDVAETLIILCKTKFHTTFLGIENSRYK